MQCKQARGDRITYRAVPAKIAVARGERATGDVSHTALQRNRNKSRSAPVSNTTASVDNGTGDSVCQSHSTTTNSSNALITQASAREDGRHAACQRALTPCRPEPAAAPQHTTRTHRHVPRRPPETEQVIQSVSLMAQLRKAATPKSHKQAHGKTAGTQPASAHSQTAAPSQPPHPSTQHAHAATHRSDRRKQSR